MNNRFSPRRAALFLCLFALAALAVFVSPSSSGQGRARVREDVGRSLAGYDELQLDPAAVAERVRKDGRLTLATTRGTFELELEPSDIRAENYRAVVVEENGVSREIERTPSRTYKGTVRGRAGAQARFSIDEQKIEGLIVAGDEIYFVEPSKNYSPVAGAKDFVFYPESSVKAESFGACGTTLAQRVGERAASVAPGSGGGAAATTKGVTADAIFGPRPEVEVATEADFEYFQLMGSANAANAEILDIMNQVDGIYDAQLGIKMRIVFQRVWSVAGDPYTETKAGAALDQFRIAYNSSFAAGELPSRDLTHMWTGKALIDDETSAPGTIGIAYISAVCNAPTFSYGISQKAFASTNIRRVVLTAHEMGHNFGAEHPDLDEKPAVAACAPSSTGPGTGAIMNSFVTPSTSFCQFSRDEITNHVAINDSCLTRLTQPNCTYALSPAHKRFGIEGGTGSVNVSTSLPQCGWEVAEGATWLAVTAGDTGVGPGASSYSVSPNSGGPLATVVDIAGQKLTVVQDASPNCPKTPIAEGNTSGVLDPTDCRSGKPDHVDTFADLYTFNGVAGQRVRIEMNASINPNQPGTGLDTYLYVFGPNGAIVAENDDIDTGQGITNSRIPVNANAFFTLPQTGTYIVEATSFDNISNDRGAYTLALSFSVSPSNQTSIAGGGSLTVAEGVGADGIGTEGVGFRTVSVTRSVTGGAASVDYATSNGTASSTSDYTAALGTLNFAPGEATKSFMVFVTDDAFLEPDETVNITLSNPVGTTLPAASTAVLTITSNDASSGPSPVREQSFNTRFFVRQHYLDFFGREPDAGGMSFWSNGLESCGTNAQCLLNKRIDTSAAFFLSIEFQETGFLVQRMYKTAYGDAVGQATISGVLTNIAVPVVRLNEFLPDTQRIGLNVIVGSAGWPERLEANKVAFTQEFVSRSRFTTAFAGLTPTQFVDRLITNSGIIIESADRDALINELTANNTTAGRASVLRKVAEDPELAAAETNKAFVLMQFFGYLRRNPNDAPDTNHSGYNFWLKKLNDNGGDFRSAQMVLAFLDSIEYKQRFGQP